jgi:two-component system response regulator
MKAKKILLVEDNPDDQELILMALDDGNIANEIVALSDGMQALDYLFGRGAYAGRDVSDTPLFILLDLKLPKVNGLEVLQQLRADPRTTFIPVVMLTSSNEERDVFAGYENRVNSYVRKPVEIDQFTEAVKKLKLYWVILNETPPTQQNS